MEDRIRRIQGIEYIVLRGPDGLLYVQDFVRFPRLVQPAPSAGAAAYGRVRDSVYLDNASRANAAAVCGSNYERAVVYGQPGRAEAVGDGCLKFGVHAASLDDRADCVLVADPHGVLLGPLRASRRTPPIAFMRADSSPQLAAEWDRRSQVGLFRLPSASYDYVSAAMPHVSTELLAGDCAAGAVHAANSLFECWDILLDSADLSVSSTAPVGGMVEVAAGRWMWPQQTWTLGYLAAVCHVIQRNGGRVRYRRGTMAEVEGLEAVDTPTKSGPKGKRTV